MLDQRETETHHDLKSDPNLTIQKVLLNIGYSTYHVQFIFLALLACSLEGIVFTQLSICVSEFQTYLNFTTLEVEIINSALHLGVGIGSLTLGKINSKIKRKTYIKISLVMLIVAQFTSILVYYHPL